MAYGTFWVICQQMFQISESLCEVLQSVLHVEVFFSQSVDGVLELVAWATACKQRNQPQNGGDLHDREHYLKQRSMTGCPFSVSG